MTLFKGSSRDLKIRQICKCYSEAYHKSIVCFYAIKITLTLSYIFFSAREISELLKSPQFPVDLAGMHLSSHLNFLQWHMVMLLRITRDKEIG